MEEDKPEITEEDLCLNHRLFLAEYFANDFNQRKAYKKIYGNNLSDEVADTNASRLLRLAKVKEIVERKKKEILAIVGIDPTWALNKRLEIIELSMSGHDAAGANAALTAIEKMHLGLTEKQDVRMSGAVAILSMDDKDKEIYKRFVQQEAEKLRDGN